MFRPSATYRRQGGKALLLLACLAGSCQVMAQPDEDELDVLVDPTAPLNLNAVATQAPVSMFNLMTSYKLSSILVRPNLKVAVINSRRVSEGEMIGSAQVVRIDKDSVVLEVAGEEQVIELYSRSIKSMNNGDD